MWPSGRTFPMETFSLSRKGLLLFVVCRSLMLKGPSSLSDSSSFLKGQILSPSALQFRPLNIPLPPEIQDFSWAGPDWVVELGRAPLSLSPSCLFVSGLCWRDDTCCYRLTFCGCCPPICP